MSTKNLDTKVRTDMTLPKELQEHIVTRIEDHLKFDQFTEVHMAWDIGNYAYTLGKQELESQVRELRDTVEKLREVLVYFEDEAISSCPAEFVSYDRAEKFAEKVRFVLSDKGVL